MLSLMKNLILNTDSYKASHYLQYPEKTETIFSYIESRGGIFPETVFFGLQILLKEYLVHPITLEMIEEAAEFWEQHGEPFHQDGWLSLLQKYNGYLPIRIRAVPEGSVIPTQNVLVTIENTDPEFYWLPQYLETLLLRGVWYPTTVASQSYVIKKIIYDYLTQTAEHPAELLPFKLHDFGARGVSSFESAGIGGVAHLVNFRGSDTVTGILTAKKYYGCPMAAVSVPASEHAVITVWGQSHEAEAYEHILKQFSKRGQIVSVVSDSYDIFNAVEHIYGEKLKEKIVNSGVSLVIRPDSGDPVMIVSRLLEILAEKFGYTTNSKGYKVLNQVRILQGDGINRHRIHEILEATTALSFSAENLIFGIGGVMLQQVHRDTLSFAMKVSAAKVNGIWREVYKTPLTDPNKNSKRGRLTLVREQGQYKTVQIPYENTGAVPNDVLRTVFENGKITKEYHFDEIRQRASF